MKMIILLVTSRKKNVFQSFALETVYKLFFKKYKDQHRMKTDTKPRKFCILKLFIDYRIAGGEKKQKHTGYIWVRISLVTSGDRTENANLKKYTQHRALNWR